ncbi:sarcosine oxidase subunit gamma [Rubellimicrobium roseum]|uniref:Sarcosine oxidase subunit gamma n=1 Tax=Rubellimicrobium roseum TaxID=687525 RepID=A0A5C4NIT1_9RHOB|nr:sarcosine oxidase subunit gamma [Rubellimicrobium roseum]TNC72966.1 sarcosine oxidase subunit gamma [Rubellimicrobium roseum]
MVRLLEASPAQGLGLPLSVGGATLSEVVLGPVWSIAPFAGRAGALAEKLGVALPAPDRVVSADDVRLLWAGPGRALLVGGVPPDLSGLAAVVEQGDGIVAVALEGLAARDVLARLVPLDLRDVAFPEGATARTLLNHMSATLLRTGPQAYEVLGMRSMAGTLVREIGEAMRHVAGREEL